MIMNLFFNVRNCLKTSTRLMKRTLHLRRKILSLKKKLNEVKENFSKVEASQISLEKVNEELLKNNGWLISSLSKFSCGQKVFDMILASQNVFLIKWD